MNHQFRAGIQVSRISPLHGRLFTDFLTSDLLIIYTCSVVPQTIAIIPVLPRGVLQLGSTSVVRCPAFDNAYQHTYPTTCLEVYLVGLGFLPGLRRRLYGQGGGGRRLERARRRPGAVAARVGRGG